MGRQRWREFLSRGLGLRLRPMSRSSMLTVNLRKLVVQLVCLMLVFGLPLFGAAGTLAWPSGWLFLGLFFSFVGTLTAWLLERNPALLAERMTVSRADQKAWDKVLLAVTFVVFLGWLVLMPLDAV